MASLRPGSSVGWIGAVIACLALGVVASTGQDTRTVRAAWIAMELTGWFVIVPLALASLLTGVVMALGTPWGLFRHYWVLFSFVLTVFATVILLLHMPTVSVLAGVAAERTVSRSAGWGATSSTRARPPGAARDSGAECVQAAGHDAVRMA